MPARPEDEVGKRPPSTERKNEKAAKKIFRHLRSLLVGRRGGLERGRSLSDLVDTGKRTTNRKAHGKQKTSCQYSQASKENCAEAHRASWTSREPHPRDPDGKLYHEAR